MDFTKNQLPVMSDNQKIKICIVVEDGLVSEIFAKKKKKSFSCACVVFLFCF